MLVFNLLYFSGSFNICKHFYIYFLIFLWRIITEHILQECCGYQIDITFSNKVVEREKPRDQKSHMPKVQKYILKFQLLSNKEQTGPETDTRQYGAISSNTVNYFAGRNIEDKRQGLFTKHLNYYQGQSCRTDFEVHDGNPKVLFLTSECCPP